MKPSIYENSKSTSLDTLHVKDYIKLERISNIYQSLLEFKTKINSYYPYLIIILISTIFSQNLELKAENIKHETLTTPKSEKADETLLMRANNGVAIMEQNRVLLTPSFNFIDQINSKSNVEHHAIITSKTTEINIENIEKNTLHVEEEKSFINIQRKDEQSAIEDVIKRFNISHNPELSLFIAKKYYHLGNYEQAYNYALMTNNINNNMQWSWIVFSKSLFKLNKKELAVETLKKYISYSNSSQAKQLLDEITSGEFK
ncbi:hypothetical protein Suden_1385 [Sulfurimonas denitrificans DSM 1251]|uniref:Transformation system protein n=1 Tax=Sulfurimonas denitrificans (strain ATCC 33889 / DSM 1251) TaxID=326298 RepID=Q30QR9_SULDN|nr:hypothetical protein [Sulfurimonas denitrificans]ABB44662.1 hypothetical protein Suden_1385 [Sulfurimonas denitrificans DSM 1251]MDD3442860.1 hypothetical protein [Sulfurimonas denitrificans]